MSENWLVRTVGGETTAVFEPADAPAKALFVMAHGAGGHRDDKGMLALSAEFRRRSIDVVRFNFFYSEKGSGRPDRMPLLRECLAMVAERARSERHPERLLIGGRSMGGRVASMMAADGFDCDALLLLAYPLHPAGKPEALRDKHLPDIEVPVLCFNGTRDGLCRRDLMEQVIARLRPSWTQHWIEAADHSFHVTRSSGRNDADVLEEVGAATESWLSTLPQQTDE